MKFYDSCKDAMEHCKKSQSFSVAHLYKSEKAMNIHIHDSYEIYYSISGGKQFLIDNRFYDLNPGDILFINQYESHYLSQIDSTTHERIVLSIWPEFLKSFCSETTDIDNPFKERNTSFGHKLSLDPQEQKRFLYYIHKLSEHSHYGQDILDTAAFLELMVFLADSFRKRCSSEPATSTKASIPESTHSQIQEILSYVNQNLSEELTIKSLAEHFYLSSSYLCKIFKDETGTTINRYITAKRITYAKSLLTDGYSVSDTCTMCGFGDYSNFLKSFTKSVGISPKKYSQFSR